jgi:hypothetical protein
MRVLAPASVCVALAMAGGCGEPESGAGQSGASVPLPPGLLLSAAPEGPRQTIADLKTSATAGDRVTARVKIGGRAAPIVSGAAVMTVVDAHLPNPCEAGGEGHCATPWDYCCSDPAELIRHTATVQISDGAGQPLALDVAGAGLRPGRVLVINAVVTDRPNEQTLVLDADGLFLEPEAFDTH